MEQNYSEDKKEITAVQTSQIEIKGTLLEEGQKQKELINEQKKEIKVQQKEQKGLMDQLIANTLGIKKNNNTKV